MHLQQIMDYALPDYRCLAPNLFFTDLTLETSGG